MSLQPCPSCGQAVSTHAVSCPNCGHPLKSSKNGLGFWGVVGAIIVAIIIMSFC